MFNGEDARKDPVWADSPTAKAGIFSYLGFPVFWPDGDVFGTICAVDTKANRWLTPSDTLLRTVKDAVEAHLALVATSVEFDLWLRYMDRLPIIGIKSYIAPDVRLCWKPKRNIELSITGLNLTHHHRMEFISELINTLPTETDRSVFRKINWNY